jgi:hypothetical protein
MSLAPCHLPAVGDASAMSLRCPVSSFLEVGKFTSVEGDGGQRTNQAVSSYLAPPLREEQHEMCSSARCNGRPGGRSHRVRDFRRRGRVLQRNPSLPFDGVAERPTVKPLTSRTAGLRRCSWPASVGVVLCPRHAGRPATEMTVVLGSMAALAMTERTTTSPTESRRSTGTEDASLAGGPRPAAQARCPLTNQGTSQ